MKAICLTAAFFLAITAAVKPAHPADKIPLKIDEVNFALEMHRDMHGYARASGVLADLVRSIAQEATISKNSAAAEAAASAEDLINEAGLSASQGDYETSFGLLGKAAKIILEIISKINSGG